MRDLVIIGGGSAGLAAALGAYEEGVRDILIIERSDELGGILNQCIHNGFGLHTFKEELTGPEYAARFISEVNAKGIEYKLSSMVVDLKAHEVAYVNKTEGFVRLRSKAIVLAMGCRERSRGALNIPGFRPAGIFSAGAAQYFVNILGQRVGKRVVILGSGDIGLIMARRLTLEGAKVLAVAELMPYSGGLKRNIVQCLDDYNIPLLLSHTVVDIKGKERVEGVTIAEVDEKREIIRGSEVFYPCDTLLLSVGLLPENELSIKAGIEISPITGGPVVDDSFETSADGIFASGNVLHVHDLVDYVSEEAKSAGRSAASYIFNGRRSCSRKIRVEAKGGVRYTVPEIIRAEEGSITLRFRVGNVFRNVSVLLTSGKNVIKRSRKRYMAPGEMEKISIDASALADDLTVEIVND